MLTEGDAVTTVSRNENMKPEGTDDRSDRVDRPRHDV